MLVLTQAQLTDTLAGLGLRPGEAVMVHAAVQLLGQPQDGPGMYYAAFDEVLGLSSQQGTLVVPVFNFAFAQGQPFDQQATSSEGMGVLAEYVRQHPHAWRSCHPLQSVAAVGKHAADLAGRDTACAFDPGSAFERMLQLDFKLVLFGASVQFVSMIHYCEQRASVPYRFWKDFTGLVRLQPPVGSGSWETRTYRMFARDLELNPRINSLPVQQALEARGLWQSTKLNYGRVALCRLADFVTVAAELLAADPWVLVENRPD